ncbi:hypothetical protein NDU88_004506 [Pleurodeles waltl]|uniref:Uncharacterized protein n=1 Tax=Pleurodeles waltl TaxID=8319 RepID=A0AAV7KYK9_PLEWA|nr:hypothetical protein NDU88_004506 [Pleurodeles waltl]
MRPVCRPREFRVSPAGPKATPSMGRGARHHGDRRGQRGARFRGDHQSGKRGGDNEQQRLDPETNKRSRVRREENARGARGQQYNRHNRK